MKTKRIAVWIAWGLAILYFAVVAYGKFHYLLPWHVDENSYETLLSHNFNSPDHPYQGECEFYDNGELKIDGECMRRSQLLNGVRWCLKADRLETECTFHSVSIGGQIFEFPVPNRSTEFYR